MKFKIIEQDNSRKVTGVPKLRFTKNGSISVNGAGVEKLSIPNSPHVIFVQDEEKPNDFYLIINEDKKYPSLRKSSGKSMVVSYASAYHVLCKHFQIPQETNFDVKIGGQIKTELGTAFYLLTGDLKNINKEVANG